MEWDVLIEVISDKFNAGGYSRVSGTKVHYGDYSDLVLLRDKINNANYNATNEISKAYIVTLDMDHFS